MLEGSYFRRVSNDYGRFSQWTTSEVLVAHEIARLRRFSLRSRAVLDVGAGTGRFLQRIASENVYPGAALLAVDLSPDMLRSIEIPDGEACGGRMIARIIGDVCQLPIADRSVDRVVGRQVLHYVEPLVAIHEIARVLRTGGIYHSTQQVDYDDIPDDWYTEWSALRNAPSRRRLSNRHLDDVVRRVRMAEVSRSYVPIRLSYTWQELAYKYGKRDDAITGIVNFFQKSPAYVKDKFSMDIRANSIGYSSRFRVSAFQIQA